MSNLGLTRQKYSLLSARERTIFVVRDHLTMWFQALSDDAQMKELEANAKRNAHRSSPARARRS